ncbi:MAG: DUF262 domain-containing protein, partial [Micromonosporaceae bacterium]|nr:DUF262 domain-containing protein [Micromonosporaceae bacterium]
MMDRIGGQPWTVRSLFGRRYVLDTYQREYEWKRAHLQDLINDLTTHYLSQRKPEHELRDVATFEPYFLGPIITHHAPNQTIIVDGQQRLTTLMLLLVWLHRLQADRDDAVPALDTLIVSDHFGHSEFAVEDPVMPRRPVLSALLGGHDVRLDRALTTSEKNLVARYTDIDELFPVDVQDDDLPFFIYWLLDRVVLVEISTRDSAFAVEAFETMNDRGMRLGAADLLKSFLLNSARPADRPQINHLW